MKHLLNTPNVRIRQKEQGYLVQVEVEKKTWYGRKYKVWTHAISYQGLKDKPFYYSTYEMAKNQFLKYMEWDITYQSYNH